MSLYMCFGNEGLCQDLSLYQFDFLKYYILGHTVEGIDVLMIQIFPDIEGILCRNHYK
jgi:hypothetical protein